MEGGRDATVCGLVRQDLSEEAASELLCLCYRGMGGEGVAGSGVVGLRVKCTRQRKQQVQSQG